MNFLNETFLRYSVMKKYIIRGLVAAASFLLIACGNNSNDIMKGNKVSLIENNDNQNNASGEYTEAPNNQTNITNNTNIEQKEVELIGIDDGQSHDIVSIKGYESNIEDMLFTMQTAVKENETQFDQVNSLITQYAEQFSLEINQFSFESTGQPGTNGETVWRVNTPGNQITLHVYSSDINPRYIGYIDFYENTELDPGEELSNVDLFLKLKSETNDVIYYNPDVHTDKSKFNELMQSFLEIIDNEDIFNSLVTQMANKRNISMDSIEMRTTESITYGYQPYVVLIGNRYYAVLIYTETDNSEESYSRSFITPYDNFDIGILK